MGWTFPVLSDTKAEVIRRFDLLHATGGEAGDISRPGEFLIDPSGTVRWRDLTESYWVRARPETVLGVFDDLAAGDARTATAATSRRDATWSRMPAVTFWAYDCDGLCVDPSNTM